MKKLAILVLACGLFSVCSAGELTIKMEIKLMDLHNVVLELDGKILKKIPVSELTVKKPQTELRAGTYTYNKKIEFPTGTHNFCAYSTWRKATGDKELVTTDGCCVTVKMPPSGTGKVYFKSSHFIGDRMK
ncbi:hypothetical protein ACFL2B_02045 [Patescibacteria group bacterium]